MTDPCTFTYSVYLGWVKFFVFALPDWQTIVLGLPDNVSVFYENGEPVEDPEKTEEVRIKEFWEDLGR